jgi:hypothetical protein
MRDVGGCGGLYTSGFGRQGGLSPATPSIQVVLNWLEELKARVPAK